MVDSKLYQRIQSDELLVAPGAFDGLTANIIESIGFEAVYLGGYAVGTSTAHTEPILSMTEMCDRAREITSSVKIPLIADGNAGFGNPAHTYRTVNEFAKAGIDAIHIEDQVFPKRLHYHAGIKHIVDEKSMIAKIRAAVQSREEHEEDIVIIARTDAARDQRRSSETIEDATNRLNQYLDAGADAAMLFPDTREELQYAVEEVDGPVVFVMVEGREPNLTTNELDELGVAVSLNALSATVAVGQSIYRIYSQLHENGHTGLEMEMFNEYRTFVEEQIDLPKYYEIEERSGFK